MHRLKKQIEQGTYHVDSTAVADAVLRAVSAAATASAERSAEQF